MSNKILGLLTIFVFAISLTEKIETQEVLGEKCVSSENGLKVRSLPNKDSKPLGSLKYQQIVTVLKYSDNSDKIGEITAKWAQIKFTESEGWVYSGFLAENCNKENQIYQGLINYNNFGNPVFSMISPEDTSYRLGEIYKNYNCDNDEILSCFQSCSYEGPDASCKLLSFEVKNDEIIIKIKHNRGLKIDKHIEGVYICKAKNQLDLGKSKTTCQKSK
ncbi:SH3 domain-containing protein [Leptospira terpstrae]|uniref:SH3 domain-containing protein n=1 Tax=Leptospira terpstrae TaxID=293075 RepID=UPI003CFF4EE3